MVFPAGETEPFAQDAVTLDLYVAPLLGADCMLLGGGGRWMLVDMGKQNDYPVIRGLLDSLGVGRIDIAFNTHPHSDHIGSMAQLAQDVPVGRFITAYPLDYAGSSIRQVSTVKALDAAGVPVEQMGDGGTFAFGGAEFRVLRTDSRDTNASSAMLHIRFGERSILLAADVNRLSQGKLAGRYDLSADVLKYPHHGQEKMDKLFTETVAPEFAFFTHGSSNTKEGQKWLDRYGIGYRFATWGVIHIQTDGQRIIVDQELTEDGLRYRDHWGKAG